MSSRPRLASHRTTVTLLAEALALGGAVQSPQPDGQLPRGCLPSRQSWFVSQRVDDQRAHAPDAKIVDDGDGTFVQQRGVNSTIGAAGGNA